MRRKIQLLIALLIGASLCSQQVFALTMKQIIDDIRKKRLPKQDHSFDIIKNNTSNDIGYTIHTSCPTSESQQDCACSEGVVLANNKKQIEDDSNCPRNKINSIYFEEKMDENLPWYSYLYRASGYIGDLNKNFIEAKGRIFTIHDPKANKNHGDLAIAGAKPQYDIEASQ